MKMRSATVVAALLLAVSAFGQSGPTVMQQVYMAKRLLPAMKTVAVFCHTQHAAGELKQLQVACTAQQLELKTYHTDDLVGLRERFERMIAAADKTDLVWVLPDDVANQKFGRRFLSERCIAQKIPLFVYSVDLVREGALFSVGNDPTGALKIFFNKKVGSLIQATIPAEAETVVVNVE